MKLCCIIQKYGDLTFDLLTCVFVIWSQCTKGMHSINNIM